MTQTQSKTQIQSQSQPQPQTQPQSQTQPQPQAPSETQIESQNEGQSKEGESGIVISDQSSGNINTNPLMVSTSPSHPNHQKHDEIQKTPPSALGTTHQQSQVSKVSNKHYLQMHVRLVISLYCEEIIVSATSFNEKKNSFSIL